MRTTLHGLLWRTLALCVATTPPLSAADVPLKVFATLPDLGSLARTVGGDAVDVTVMARGGEDPHFIEPKPSFIKQLSAADVYVQNGLELESGYAPLLLKNARNPKILPGTAGYVDASRAITPLDVPVGTVTRAMGDVHAFGNPHYLLDPLNGLKVAALLRDTLTALRPAAAQDFATRYSAFRQQLYSALVGPALAATYDAEKLATLYQHGALEDFLSEQGDAGSLAGWLGTMQPYRGARFVDDHNLWPYFAARFGLQVLGHLEPKPGIPPSTSHLAALIEQMRAERVLLLVAAPYYDPRHARFVAEHTGARIATLANIAGAQPGTAAYLEMIDYNVRQIATALAAQ